MGKTSRTTVKVANVDDAALLAQLLDAWRARRHPRLAALIEAVSAHAALAVAPLEGDTPDARDKAWRKRSKSPAPEAVAGLLATLREGVKVAAVGERVDALGRLDADPRVAAYYLGWFRAPPFTASSHKPVWTEVLRQLRDVHRDPRVVGALEALAPTYTVVFGDTVMGRWMQAQLTKLAAALATDAPPTMTPADEALVATLEARFKLDAPSVEATATTAAPVDDETALLQAIAATPQEDAPREAYRAWLAAKGDPRAEFIALQRRREASDGALPPDDAAREAALMEKHLTAWLGPLAPVVRDVRFTRGFLTECRLFPRGTKTGPAVGDPRWATVETLHFTTQKNWGRDVALHPVLRGVRRLEDAPTELAEALLHDTTLRDIESIACTYGIHPRALPATLTAPGLPRLLEFGIDCWHFDAAVSKYSTTWRPPDVFADFLQSPLAARLAVLHWGIHDSFIDDLHTTLLTHAPPTFAPRVEAYFATFLRGDDGRWSHVELRIDSHDDELKNNNARLRTARRLTAHRVSRVTVRLGPAVDAAKLAAELDALRAHFAHADVRVVTS